MLDCLYCLDLCQSIVLVHTQGKNVITSYPSLSYQQLLSTIHGLDGTDISIVDSILSSHI